MTSLNLIRAQAPRSGWFARTRRALLAAAMAPGLLGLAPVLTAPASAQERVIRAGSVSGERLKLGLNKAIVLELPSDAYDILVANPAVADAVTRTARRIYLFGKSVGETNIIIFGAGGEQIARYDLTIEQDVSGLEDYLRRFIPGADITVELLKDNVVLTGSVETPLDASRAVEIATAFVSGGEATTGQFAQTAAGGDAAAGVAINNPDQTRRTSRIVNLLKIVGEDQVTLKVTVAEISRNVMKQLGVNLLAGGVNNGITWGAVTENLPGLGKPLSDSTALTLGNGTLGAYFNAMEQAGVMKTLAEPTLTAVSGEKAQFRVGGEFNLVTQRDVDQNTGQASYQYERIEYGIGLEFLPTVLSAGRISLKVRTSVSEPTNQGSVPLGGGITRDRNNAPNGVVGGLGTNMISIRKRLADTTIELPSGGSMMIAGLVQDDVRQAFTGVPGLSKVPVLGTLFRSRDFVRNQTELVIIVTPLLSKPVARNDLAKPDDNFTPASDGAGYFLGRVNRVYGTMQTDKPAGRYHGVIGFIYK